MNLTAKAARPGTEPSSGFLYGWLLLCLFMEYARPASFFPFLNIPSLYSILPLLLFLVTLFAPGVRSAREAFSDKQAKWIFALLGVVFLSFVVFRAYAIEVFTSVLGYVMLFTVIARVCTTWTRIRGVAKMLIFAHVFLLAMNPQVLLDPSTRQYIKGATFLGDGNDFGLSICLLFPLGLWLAQTSPSKLGKLLNYATLLLLLYAIVASQSRGATLGIGATFLFLWWWSRYKVVGGVVIAVAAVGILALAPSAYTSRMSTLSNPTDGSAQGRIDAWKAGIGMGAKNPLIGVGAGHFGPRWGKTAHSTYVLAFGELGLPGFICVLAIVIGNIRSTMNLRKRIVAANLPASEPEESKPVGVRDKSAEAPREETAAEKVSRALLYSAAAMIGFGVAGAFLSATYYPHLYVLTGLMIATRAIASKETGVAVETVKVRARPGNRQAAQPVPTTGQNDGRARAFRTARDHERLPP
jgi:putative inorganic carbon (hco3(-)) transporter